VALRTIASQGERMRELLQKATPAELAALPEEDLARAILAAMRKRERDGRPGMANRREPAEEIFSYAVRVGNYLPQQQRQLKEKLERNFRRTFDWLEQNRLIETASGAGGAEGFMILTPEGRELVAPIDLDQVRMRAWLRQDMLHPKLKGRPYKDFYDGRLSSAVFEAFRIVEVETRLAAGLPDTELGQNLMMKAFGENGALTKATESKESRDALARLFAGAMGRFGNPGAHAHRSFEDALEAIEELLLASRLLRFLDQRAGSKGRAAQLG
jgi:uncharacterized protein (TIGR02391 family)